MGMYSNGHAWSWSCIVNYGPVWSWSCMVKCVHVWSSRFMYGHIWLYMGISRMVNHHPKCTIRKCTTDFEFGIKTQLTKLRPGEMPWMPIHYPQDGHPPSQGWLPTVQNLPKGSILQT